VHSRMLQTCRYDLLCGETLRTAQIYEKGKIALRGDSHEVARGDPATELEDLGSAALNTPQLHAGKGTSGQEVRNCIFQPSLMQLLFAVIHLSSLTIARPQSLIKEDQLSQKILATETSSGR